MLAARIIMKQRRSESYRLVYGVLYPREQQWGKRESRVQDAQTARVSRETVRETGLSGSGEDETARRTKDEAKWE